MTDDMKFESKIAGLDPEVIESGGHPGELAGFTCPECAGPLYEIKDGKLVRFRCRVGHAFTAEDAKLEALESALFTALNTLEESAQMAESLAARSSEHGRTHATSRFESRAKNARQQAATIRAVLINETSDSPADAG